MRTGIRFIDSMDHGEPIYTCTLLDSAYEKATFRPGIMNYTDGHNKNELQQDCIPDLSRLPPPRSQARGIMSRYQMDKLDGVNVNRVLEINPLFYSKDYCREDKCEIASTVCVAAMDAGGTRADVVTVESGKDKPKKTSIKKRLQNIIRRLLCTTYSPNH